MSPDKRRVQLIVFACLGVILLLGAGAWWWMAVGRWPLRGDLRHDFGGVVMSERPMFLDHTFKLRNHTDETIVVEGVRPTCGCVKAELSDETIEPGEQVMLKATLRLLWPGKKDKTQIHLILQDLGVQTLHLSAKGLDDPDWQPPPHVSLPRGGEQANGGGA